MNATSKLMFSAEELWLMQDTNFILTKRKIIDQINSMFGQLAFELENKLKSESQLPAEIKKNAAKITKGENYLGLPYLILDYPRCFEKEDIFAIRTMFWWGNFFSCTLQLSGKYYERFLPVILKNLEAAKNNGFYYCVHTDFWAHHFEPDNYLPLKNLSEENISKINAQRQFIKLAAKFSITDVINENTLLENCFNDLLQLLTY